MPAPAAVTELVERFEANRESYRSGGYKEAQLREEFVNPLFAALGWDVAQERYLNDLRDSAKLLGAERKIEKSSPVARKTRGRRKPGPK